MFGTYRLALAMAVATQHLLSIPAVGDHGLHGFFLLSGFLITRVLCTTYGPASGGIVAFAANRALRLYPVYWAVLGLSVLIIVTFGEDAARAYRRFLYLPPTAISAAQNVLLFFPSWYPGSIEPRLSPPTWSLTVEIFYYGLMAVGSSLSRRASIAWLAASIFFLVTASQTATYPHFYYEHLLAQSLPFALGAALYHYRDLAAAAIERFPRALRPSYLAMAVLVHSLLISAAIIKGATEVQTYALFTNLLLQVSLIAALEKFHMPARQAAVDRWFGDLAYPVFLLHWQVGFAMAMVMFGQPVRGASPQGVLVFLPTMAVTCVLAAILVKTVDHPVQRLRRRLRPALPEAAPAGDGAATRTA